MDTAATVRTALTASLSLLVLTIGMRCSVADAFYLFRRVGLLARSFVAMNVLAPILVLCLMTMWELRPEIRIALIALSLAPVPPVLPNRLLKLVNAEGYVIGVLFATSLCAVVFIPLAMELFKRMAYVTVHVRSMDVLRIVAASALVPLLIGMGIRFLWPAAAELLHAKVSIVATAILVVACFPILIAAWPSMHGLFGDGTLLMIVAATVLWLAVGHALGGPRQQDRSVLALATASRHPAVAVAVASTSFPDQKLVPAAVLLSFLVVALVSIPYVIWRKRVFAGPAHEVS